MKPFLRTIFIWILSLSLTGLPMVAMSQNLVDVSHAEKDMAMGEQTSDAPCHSKVVQTDENAAQDQTVQTTVADASIDKGCCCGADCQCQSDMGCQSVHSSSASAILQSVQFISFPLISLRAVEPVVSYDNCNSDVEITPHIV